MKSTVITLAITALLGMGLIAVAVSHSNGGGAGTSASGGDSGNVSLENGNQIVAITAKGGYTPRKSQAKAGVPTVLRVNTQGTFDCSSSIVIPALGVSQILPRSGSTDINIPPQAAGTTLNGLCGMGMYNFSINFI